MSKIHNGAIVYRYGPRSNTIYLNITNKCSNNCTFCIKKYSSGLSGYELRLTREPTIDEVWGRLRKEIRDSDREIVWCGFGEPTMRLDAILTLTKKIREEYPHFLIRLDTDGLVQVRNKRMDVAKELKKAGIASISISLNAENEKKYNELCRPSLKGSYQAVLDFAKDCKKHLLDVRLTVVEIGEIDISACERIAEDLGCKFKVRG